MNPTIMASCLPFNTERKENDEYLMFDIPPPIKANRQVNESMLIRIESFDDWVQKVFFGMKFLNPIQTEVKPIAFDTEENLLVCAPTGAGKTNIALMTILHEV
jgi:replicative superfamily II helicase